MESITSLPFLGDFRPLELRVLRKETAAVAKRIRLTWPLARGHVEAVGARPRAAPAGTLFRSKSLFGLLKRHFPVLPPHPTPKYVYSGKTCAFLPPPPLCDHWVPVMCGSRRSETLLALLGAHLVELAPHTSRHLRQEWPRKYQE